MSDVLKRIRSAKAQPVQPAQPSAAETTPKSAGAGGAGAGVLPYLNTALTAFSQGATLGYGDELSAIVSAALFGENDESFKETYRRHRDEERARIGKLRNENPKTFISSEIAGNIPSAVVTTPGAGAGFLGRALASGALGGVAGAGSSEADLTRGEILRGVADAGVGAATGVAAEGVGAAFKASRNLLRSATPKGATRVAAERVAEEGVDPKFLAGSADITKKVNKQVVRPGESPFVLRPSQSTNNRQAALIESAQRQLSGPEQKSAIDALELQTEQVGRFLQAQADSIAADPSKLGKADVGESLSRNVGRYINKLLSSRTEKASRAFSEVDRLTAGEAAFDIGTDTIDTLQRLYREVSGRGLTDSALVQKKGVERLLRELVDVVNPEEVLKGADPIYQPAKLTGQEFASALSAWSEAAAGSGEIFKDIDKAKGKRIAHEVFGALRSQLDTLAESASPQSAAAKALKSARQEYAVLSDEIEQVGSDVIKKILKIGEGPASDNVTTRLLASTPGEIRSVFKVIEQSGNPTLGRQLRAQLMQDVLEKSNAVVSRSAPIAAEEGVSGVSVAKGLTALKNMAPKLEAAFSGDKNAQAALRDSYRLLRRVNIRPVVEGAQTAPLATAAFEKAGKAGIPGGQLIANALREVYDILGTDKRIVATFQTIDGINAFNAALKTALGKSKNPTAYNLAVRTLSRLSQEGISDAGNRSTRE